MSKNTSETRPDDHGLQTARMARDHSRCVISVNGAEAADFLQALVTVDVEGLASGDTRPGALLTPQGRVIADFMISRHDSGFFVECDQSRGDDLFKRLRRYRLRRPIDLALETALGVWVIWNTSTPPAGACRDARHDSLGWRWLGAEAGPPDASASSQVSLDEWQQLRITAGVPQGPTDLVPERALMLEAGLDLLGAVDFEKGCYVGQEVTARTRYRGLVKRRIVPLAVTGKDVATGSTVTDSDASLGTTLSAVRTEEGSLCLAAMKLSDLHRIMENDGPLQIDGAPARLTLPDWMLPLPSPAKTDS